VLSVCMHEGNGGLNLNEFCFMFGWLVGHNFLVLICKQWTNARGYMEIR
jgi:hypothetical protein